jgi:hypothetical protein
MIEVEMYSVLFSICCGHATIACNSPSYKNGTYISSSSPFSKKHRQGHLLRSSRQVHKQ